MRRKSKQRLFEMPLLAAVRYLRSVKSHSPKAKAESNSAFAFGWERARVTRELVNQFNAGAPDSVRMFPFKRRMPRSKAFPKTWRPRTPCGGSGKHSALTAAPVSTTSHVPREHGSRHGSQTLLNARVFV